ncbi:LysR family transcriptional regulator [Priestia koreensis]|uniref:LysR family transcriptional regulator n=1 Tax=Priestia koreensis TaxID=284581 RepID=A0A0M0L4T9_9BACI|nr:LysR family transcriptional regulator [Priestia koreensis]KOO46081.1 LysR family transcriptional regulator [Priestia koreensis]
MDIKQLRYFCTIVEEKQITRAAKKLHMAQPPLSQQLKQLESELEVTLFERNGRLMEVTECGLVLYTKAKKILADLDETVVEVKSTDEGLKGVVAVGASKSCFSYLPARIKAFRETYPLVTFQLREGDTFHISELLKTRAIDLAVTRLPLESSDHEFSMIPLPKESYVFVIPQSWWQLVSKKTSVQMKEIQDFPLLLLHRINGKGQFEMIVNECKRHGFKPNVILECPDASMILSLVESEVGATIVPKSTLSAIPQLNTVALSIEDSEIVSESAVIWLKDRYLSKSAQHFLELFQQDVIK